MSICPNLHHNGPMRYIYSTLNQMCVISKKFQSPGEYTVSFLIKDKNSMELAKWIQNRYKQEALKWCKSLHQSRQSDQISSHKILKWTKTQEETKTMLKCILLLVCTREQHLPLLFPADYIPNPSKTLLIRPSAVTDTSLGHPQITAASKDSNLISAITFFVLTQIPKQIFIISWNFSLFGHNESLDKNDEKTNK